MFPLKPGRMCWWQHIFLGVLISTAIVQFAEAGSSPFAASSVGDDTPVHWQPLQQHNSSTQNERTVTPPRHRAPVLSESARQYFEVLSSTAAYTELSQYGLRTASIVDKLLSAASSHPDAFLRTARTCRPLEATLRGGDFQFWELAQAVQDHCDHNLVTLTGCSTRLGWLLASATAATMVSRGEYGPDVVASMVCAVHRLIRGKHGAVPPTDEYLSAAAFADAWANGVNRTLCVDSSSNDNGGGDNGGNFEMDNDEAKDAVAAQLCRKLEEPSCNDGQTRRTCCACVCACTRPCVRVPACAVRYVCACACVRARVCTSV
jgi:hypothetical protein